MGYPVNRSPGLFSFEFIALNLILVAAFCNVSVYYSFYHYLGAIDIPVIWRGFLVGLEPMAAFSLRLLIIPWIHLRNAFAMMAASLFLLIVTSCLYLWAVTVPSLIVLRIIHGTVFALLTASTIAIIVNFIPKEKSGQGFGAVTVATMIPYAIIPPLTEAILPYLRNEADVYAGVSLFGVLALMIIAVLHRRFRQTLRNLDEALMRRPSLPEIRENFRQRPVVRLLAASLFLYLAHATVFYFIKDLSLQIGLGDVGIFFMISMAAMMATRAFGGFLFDRINKLRLLQMGIMATAITLAILPHIGSRAASCVLAGVYGLSIGIMLPMLNALLFSASPPPLRSLNTNMTMFTLDAGYFLMPYIGGLLIASEAGFDILFYCGAGFALLALCLISGSKNITSGPVHFYDP